MSDGAAPVSGRELAKDYHVEAVEGSAVTPDDVQELWAREGVVPDDVARRGQRGPRGGQHVDHGLVAVSTAPSS